MAEAGSGGEVVKRGQGGPVSPRHRQTPRAREAQQAAFLAELRRGSSIAPAAAAAGVGRATVYEWRDRDPTFAQAWEDAYEAGTDGIEEAALRRAVEGVEKPVWYQGRQVGTTREPSDRLMELMLKARRPEKYRERHEVTHTLSPLSPEEIRAAREAGMRPEVEAAARTIASLPVIDGTAREA